MDDKQREEIGRRVTGVRLFAVYSPTAEDLDRARSLPASACPRRYCWWWHSLSFTWDTEPVQGCTFATAEKPRGQRYPDEPCCRAVPSSRVDHYEPRDRQNLGEGGPCGAKLLLRRRLGRGYLPGHAQEFVDCPLQLAPLIAPKHREIVGAEPLDGLWRQPDRCPRNHLLQLLRVKCRRVSLDAGVGEQIPRDSQIVQELLF